MTPLLLVAAGIGALVAGAFVLRSFGPRFRVGRLLATTPAASVEEALAMAGRGERRYVRLRGRIDSDEEFQDQEHRPLVFRRTRLEARRAAAWRTFEDNREQVAFEIREGLAAIAIDGGALDAGLVVVPRVSTGVAADLGERAPDDLPGDAPVRATIEQLSSVEHAVVLGVPEVGDGAVIPMTARQGRPLVLTTLEPDEAMRILAGGNAGRSRAAAALLTVGVALVGLGAVWAVVEAVT